jgi:hypothetical protein
MRRCRSPTDRNPRRAAFVAGIEPAKNGFIACRVQWRGCRAGSTAAAYLEAPMQSELDPNYLYYRAEEELELAQAAEHPAAVKAHYLLAGHYLDSFYGAVTPATDAPAAPANEG